MFRARAVNGHVTRAVDTDTGSCTQGQEVRPDEAECVVPTLRRKQRAPEPKESEPLALLKRRASAQQQPHQIAKQNITKLSDERYMFRAMCTWQCCTTAEMRAVHVTLTDQASARWREL